MEAPHYHWEFVAFDEDDPNYVGKIQWAVTVNVIGFSCESEARDAASGLVQRKQHRLTRVWECTTCRFQERHVEAIREMTEAMK